MERKMAYELGIFGDGQFSAEFVEWLVDERWADIQNHFGKFWEYYHNRTEPLTGASLEGAAGESARPYVQAQEYGLPSRITGVAHTESSGVFGGKVVGDIRRKEVVIENDITWRINALVDFLFGKEIQIVSRASDDGKRAEIEQILKALYAANGAIGFFQDMAVLGSVYGFVDCIVRAGEQVLNYTTHGRDGHATSMPLDDVLEAVSGISLELIEAGRALPVLDENDYKKINYYVQHFYQQKNQVAAKGSFLGRLFGGSTGLERETIAVTEIIGPSAWQRYENRQLVAEGSLPWGFLPVVHIQNVAQPYYYEGLSDVEQLIGLQDELNTRMSDRANRITFQAFKMYLAKGIEEVNEKPVSPGRMWYTSNPDAHIETFGGDTSAPSEDLHIAEIREALDKTSGVTPVVAGVLKSKLGNLTSAVALRVVMSGTLSKTERKRFTYGEGLKRISQMVLQMLDTAGLYKTTKRERELEILFPCPLPENMMEKLQEAQIKKELGVSQEQVLRELGYDAAI
jgi:hypothetical protein